MFKKLFRILLIGLICTNLNIITIFSNTNATGYAPCDDEILPVDTITTGDKALSDINIRIFQPFFNEMDETTSSIVGHELPNGIISDAQCPVAPVKTFQNTYGALIKTIRTYNKPIALEDIQSLGPNQIIIFSGHGTWMGPEIHSTILTGRLFDYDAYENNPLYRQDCDEGRIVNDVGNEAITAKYIEKYCPNLNNSFIFLAVCQGAYHMNNSLDPYRDQTLVDAFLSKGAKAVFAYSETTDMRYSNLMLYKIMTQLGEGKTLAEAFANAKNTYGEHDPSFAQSTPLIFPTSTAGDFSIDTIFNIDAPIQINYTFDGKPITGVLNGVGYTLSGDTTKTNAGNYTAIATLIDGFKWPDGTTDTKTINWSITKATMNEEDLIPNNIKIKYDGNRHDLLTIRNKNLGTYYFRLKGESVYSQNIPSAINVGEYEIEWYYVGGDNANDIASASSPISYKTNIIKGTRPQMEAKLDDYYYGKSLPTPYLTEDVEQEATIEYFYFKSGDFRNHYKWENMTSTSLELGTYNIYAKITNSSNYEDCETFDTTFKVLEYIPKPEPSSPNTNNIYKVPKTGIDSCDMSNYKN